MEITKATKKRNKKNTGSVQVSVRVRKFQAWEDTKHFIIYENDENEQCVRIGIKTQNNQSKLHIHHRRQEQEYHFMPFSHVFKPKDDTDRVFKDMCQPLCENLIQSGFNSIILCYGQTGSGKTFTMIGNPCNDQSIGILPMCVQYILQQPSVRSASMKAIEVYAISSTKIQIFDLFDNRNSNCKWEEKKTVVDASHAKFLPVKSTRKSLKNKKGNIFAMVEKAQSAAHYAPTGKNPQSSRGHILFVIQMTDGHVADFLCLDLAGSEGMSALTTEFQRKVGPEVTDIRRMEAGVINYGLQQLQKLFTSVGTRKGINRKLVGSGLRRILTPYVLPECCPMISILFTLSPSFSNIQSTRSTIRVAQHMANLKIIPKKIVVKISKNEIIRELKKTAREQTCVIEKLHTEIAQLQGSKNDENMNEDERQSVLENTFSAQDLRRKQVHAEECRKSIMSRIEIIKVGKEESMEIQNGEELLELLTELKEVDNELIILGGKISDMDRLEIDIAKAVVVDERDNVSFNIRESQALDKQLKQFQIDLNPDRMPNLMETQIDFGNEDEVNIDEIRYEETSNTVQFVRVSKDLLMKLQSQLETLARNVSEEKIKLKQEMKFPNRLLQ